MVTLTKLSAFHGIARRIFCRTFSLTLSNDAGTSYASTSRVRPLILGIETSCDDTGVAISDGNGCIVSEVVKSQQVFSTKFGGILPLFAASQHRENLGPAILEVLHKAALQLEDIDAVAVTTGPGLVVCLNEGLEVALKLCRKYNKPMIPVHHMRAHALTARMTDKVEYPFVCLLISGGHALITWVESIDKFYIIGRNLDMAPGDVFDKVARRLKLANADLSYRGLSGGALIEKFATKGDPFSIDFKMPRTKFADCNFSFSGIASQAIHKIEDSEKTHEISAGEFIPELENMCATVQHVLFKHMARKLMRAFEYIKLKQKFRAGLLDENYFLSMDNLRNDWDFSHYPKSLVVSGGVASNGYIRKGIEYFCSQYHCRPVFPPKKYCTDNGAMIAWNGLEKWNTNQDIMYKVPLSYYSEPKCPIGEDISGDVYSWNLSRYVMNHTRSNFKLNVDLNKPHFGQDEQKCAQNQQ